MIKKSLIKNIDLFIFKKVDLVKKEGVYVQLVDTLRTLNFDTKRALGLLSTTILVFIPLIIIFPFFYSNKSLKNQLSIKKQLQELVHEVVSTKKSIERLGPKILPKFPVENKSDFEVIVRNAVSRSNIPLEKVQVRSFGIQNISDDYKEVNADIHFKDLGQRDVAFFMQGLTDKERVVISNFEIEKDKNSKLLKGKFETHLIVQEKMDKR